MMKYSIILPYTDRLSQIERTLMSFVQLYLRRDFEVVVVEHSNNPDREGLFGVLALYKEWLTIVHLRYEGKGINPAPLYNFGVDNSFGENLVLSSPECLHRTNILSGLDKEFEKSQEVYIVCACESLNANGEFVSWYQHSIHRNALYHFCSAMSRKSYLSLGGFDNSFEAGYCFDDDDFRNRALSNLNVIANDDLVVAHQWHGKNYIEKSERRKLWNINRKIYESKHGKYIDPKQPAREKG